MSVIPINWSTQPRRIVGLMSGTSLDGIDAALIEVSGGIPYQSLEMIQFYTRPYTQVERERMAAVIRHDVPLTELLPASMWLGELFADAALQVIEQAGYAPDQIDAVSSHGQTIWHIPPQGGHLGATLQIGEPAVIAERTGILTVADFRPSDMAAGGQGAPLVPFADYLLFHSTERSVAVQNIGGIGNVTWLAKNGQFDEIVAFDTGPGNMVIDAVVQHFGRGLFDRDGAMAFAGKVDESLVQTLLADPYFQLAPPKSTGREKFGSAYAAELLHQANIRRLSPEDTVATATALTAESIARAYRDFLPGHVDEVILGGGGSYNPALRRMLADRLSNTIVSTHEDHGISGEAKEAIAFALLGHATLCGVPNNVPSATGATRHVVLGKLTFGRNK